MTENDDNSDFYEDRPAGWAHPEHTCWRFKGKLQPPIPSPELQRAYDLCEVQQQVQPGDLKGSIFKTKKKPTYKDAVTEYRSTFPKHKSKSKVEPLPPKQDKYAIQLLNTIIESGELRIAVLKDKAEAARWRTGCDLGKYLTALDEVQYYLNLIREIKAVEEAL